MVNGFSEIINYEGEEWDDFLNKICLIDIFKELIIKYNGDRPLLKCFMKYIVYCYSKDSNMVLIETDWLKNKKKIFDAAGFKPEKEYLDATVYLQDETVLRTIKRWVDFQDDSIYTQSTVLKDLMVEMQVSANSPIKKSSGEIDFDQKFKNACYVKDLRSMIRDCETELISNSPKLKEAYKEVSKHLSNNAKNTIGLETQLKQHAQNNK